MIKDDAYPARVERGAAPTCLSSTNVLPQAKMSQPRAMNPGINIYLTWFYANLSLTTLRQFVSR